MGGADVRPARGRRAGTTSASSQRATPRSSMCSSIVETLERPLAQGVALDFGCGVGRLTRALGTRFEQAVGVDISEAMVAQATPAERAVPACEFRVNTAFDLTQFETGSFDFVYSSIVLQHLPSRRRHRAATSPSSSASPSRTASSSSGLRPHRVPVLVPAAPAPVRAPAPARRLGGLDAAPDAADADADDLIARAEVRRRSSSVRRRRVAARELDRRGPVRALRYYVSPA